VVLVYGSAQKYRACLHNQTWHTRHVNIVAVKHCVLSFSLEFPQWNERTTWHGLVNNYLRLLPAFPVPASPGYLHGNGI